MVSPVIIDDGGSTRVKWALAGGVGDLNGLIDVDETLTPPQSSDKANGPYNHIRIVYLTKDGGSLTPVDLALVAGDKFTVTSENGQTLRLEIVATTCDCKITLLGTSAASPLVEVKQFKKKRRYIVANAGPIDTVVGVAGGAGGTAVNFDASALKSVYTSVFITG